MGFSATFLVFDWPVIDISGCFQKALVVQAGGVYPEQCPVSQGSSGDRDRA
jgi:hypothetical protein